MALPTIEQVLASPATHYWLKDALQSALTKDPVDASYDAELLAKLLRARLDSILGQTHPDIEAPAFRRSSFRAYTANVYSRRTHRSA